MNFKLEVHRRDALVAQKEKSVRVKNGRPQVQILPRASLYFITIRRTAMNIRVSDDGKGLIINGRYCKFCKEDGENNESKHGEWGAWYRM